MAVPNPAAAAVPSAKPVILSGLQPTGGIQLGNYIGALMNWVRLQREYDCLFCIVDLHGITIRHDPKEMRERSLMAAAMYIASGIDPDKSLVFVQSSVPQHAELGWILTCHTYMGELNRMTQFKDKSAKGQNIGTGLFTYPSLMAADVLLYQTNLVPVGEDQKQHLELTRDLAMRMNNSYGQLFRVPEIYIPPVGARIMSLQDPNAKMSKSDPDPHATIFMTDSDDAINKKLKRAVTDSLGVINYTDDQPGVKSLLTIQCALTGKKIDEVLKSLEGKQYGGLKQQTADVVIEAVRPVRERAEQLMNDRAYLVSVLKRSAEAARARAEVTLVKVKEALGFIAI